ncbi:MAG: hypothetical protein ACI87V_001170, partial [Flavobacteriales bacterium]
KQCRILIAPKVRKPPSFDRQYSPETNQKKIT